MDEPTSRESGDDASRLGSPLPFTLPFFSALFVLPFLDWQRAMLQAYQDALKDPKWRERWEEEAKDRGKVVLEAYLNFSKSQEELGKQWLAWQSDLVRGCLETLDGVLRSLDPKRSR